jgi:hydroxyethylthiazole kinase-like uncharacterized protein yjeF
MKSLPKDPILSPEEALAHEEKFFNGDKDLQWKIMTKAGESVADSALRDMRELRTIPHRPRILALVGKGHNGADALIAVRRFLRTIPTARAVIWQWATKDDCRSLTQRAFEELIEFASKRVEIMPVVSDLKGDELRDAWSAQTKDRGFDLLIDGLLGMQGRPFQQSPMSNWIGLLNNTEEISVRVSVDLPSGISDDEVRGPEPFRADFTYCTGIVKSSVIKDFNRHYVGRLRYLDLGFFNDSSSSDFPNTNQVLRSSALPLLRKLRPVVCDKRDFGHLLIITGSKEFAGAALMSAEGALRTGIGLLTCFIPESLQSSFAAACPEAMWVPMPETPSGSLALEGLGKIRQFLDRADALVAGPGIGPNQESHSLIREVCKLFEKPILLDADALRREIIEPIKNNKQLVITPHAGEINRLLRDEDIGTYLATLKGVLLKKGPHSSIISLGSNLHIFAGSSLLARGGSGDLLSGIIGSLLSRGQWSVADCAALGTLWHGRAAEALARQHGQEAVTTTQVLDYLSFALRNDF